MNYRFVPVTVTFLPTGSSHQVQTWVKDEAEALRLTRLTYGHGASWALGVAGRAQEESKAVRRTVFEG